MIVLKGDADDHSLDLAIPHHWDILLYMPQYEEEVIDFEYIHSSWEIMFIYSR
jgi:hypothetical protein